MTTTRKPIVGSERSPSQGRALGTADPAERAQVSVYLKRPQPFEPHRRASRAELRARRQEALAPAIQAVTEFARDHGLEVKDQDPARRLVTLGGSLGDLQAAFGTQLHMVEHAGGALRARTGVLTASAEVADAVEAVLGLDQRPVATPKSIIMPAARAVAGELPSAICGRYDFPKTPRSGGGQCVAIIELGGGVSASDTHAAFRSMGLAPPTVEAVLVSGGTNTPGADPSADGEVALDVQVAGAGAPGARLAVYFAPNTDQGFVDAISRAAHDTDRKPSVMSISWGGPESGWTDQAVAAMTSAFQDAAELGVSVFAASGDGLATDGVEDGRAHVDFPASSPLVVACGGTRLLTGSGAETVWNSEGGGTGGGISERFSVPDYQERVTLPASANPGAKPGRGVPDVAGDADPETGYQVVVDGRTQVIGGTSAVAPLWAGLFALVGELAGRSIGQPHAVLYAHPQAFNDVRRGDNRSQGVGYTANAGWDACTGLGTPRGVAVSALFGGATGKV